MSMQAVEQRRFVFETSFRVTPHQRDRWERLFGASATNRPPLTYYARPGESALRQLLGGLGVDVGDVLHLQSTAAFACEPVVVPENLSLRIELVDVVPLAATRMGLVIDVTVSTPEGDTVQTVQEVLGVHRSAPPVSAGPVSTVLLRRPPHRRGGVRAVSIDVPADLGLRYGRLSGDLNPHATRSGAARAGLQRPFLQGLCTANLLVAELARRTPLARFSVLFARPVEVDQRVELLVHDDGFELRDQNRRLVAFGTHKWAAAVERCSLR